MGVSVMVGDNIYCNDPSPVSDLKISIIDVIERPALIIESPDPYCRFYFRSIDWNHNMLITASYMNDAWVVTQCHLDPNNTFMSALFAKGKQVYG